MKQKKNLLFLVGILSVLLVFGMALVGCGGDGGEDRTVPSNNRVLMAVQSEHWGTSSSDELTSPNGRIPIIIYPEAFSKAEVTIEDLAWIPENGVNSGISFNYSSAGGRTITINSIEKQSNTNSVGGVKVTLVVTRSAVPASETARETATVTITLPPSFTSIKGGDPESMMKVKGSHN